MQHHDLICADSSRRKTGRRSVVDQSGDDREHDSEYGSPLVQLLTGVPRIVSTSEVRWEDLIIAAR